MSSWDLYERRIAAHGRTEREAALNRERHMLQCKLPSILSYHTVTIDGAVCDVAIANSDNLDEKTIYATAEKTIIGGELIHWMDNYWLVTECDANTEVYTRAKLKRCNHLLRWIDCDGCIHEQWCVVSDGTKYLTGEYEDRNFIVTRGDSRISMTIARNKDTVKFGRKSRFLIDDPDSMDKLSYQLTKPLKVGAVYNNSGVYNFVLQEVASTEFDNFELGIADYYRYFPKENTPPNTQSSAAGVKSPDGKDGKEVWL